MISLYYGTHTDEVYPDTRFGSLLEHSFCQVTPLSLSLSPSHLLFIALNQNNNLEKNDNEQNNGQFKW